MLASTLIRQTARSIIRPTEIARQVRRQALPIFTPRCPSAVRHVDRLRWTRESSANRVLPHAAESSSSFFEVSRTSGSRQIRTPRAIAPEPRERSRALSVKGLRLSGDVP